MGGYVGHFCGSYHIHSDLGSGGSAVPDESHALHQHALCAGPAD